MILPILASLLLFTTTTSKGNSSAPPNPPVSMVKPLPVKVNKTLVLQLVNEVRKKGCQCGDTYYYPVPEITWNEQLEEAALTHSSDMFQNDFFSHTAPDGSKGGVRIERAGYNWTAYGENIAAGYNSEKEVVQGWIKSPGHCKNLMNKMYKEMGVARVGKYWTQEFGRQ